MRKSWVVVSLALLGLGFFVGPVGAQLCTTPRTFSLSAWNTKPYRIYNVRQQYGNDNSNGRGRGTAWLTIDKANASAVAGTDSDAVVLVWPPGPGDSLSGSATFNITRGFNPASITGTGRVFYYSAPWWYCGRDPADGKNSIRVRGQTSCGGGPNNAGNNWTAAGFNFYAGVTIGSHLQLCGGVTPGVVCDSAQNDTVRESYIAGFADFRRARRSAFQNCTGPITFMGLPGDVNNITNHCAYIGCTFLNIRSENWHGIYVRGHGPGQESWGNKISRCNLRVTNAATSGGGKAFAVVYNQGLIVEYSTIEINILSVGGDQTNEPFLSYVRDNSDNVVFNADTILVNSPNQPNYMFMFTAPGNDVTPTRGMVIDSCYFQAGRAVGFQFNDALQATTITNSTFVAYDRPALEVTGAACMYGTSKMDHCTFITAGVNPALNLVGDPGYPGYPVCDSVVITNCLFANMNPMAMRSGTNDPTSGLRVGWGAADERAFLDLDYNFYYVKPFMLAHHDRDIMWTDTTYNYTVSKGGPTGTYAATFPPHENKSLYGWANFDAGGADTVVNAIPPCRLCTPRDSLFGANLGPASPGNAKGKDGTDPGAVQHGDQTYPVVSVSGGAWDFSRDAGNSAQPCTLRATITNAGEGTLTLSNVRSFTPWVSASLSGTTATYGQLRTLTGIVPNPGTTARKDTVYFDTNDIARPTVKIIVRLNVSRGTGGTGSGRHIEE